VSPDLERLAYLNALQYLDAQEAGELLRTGRHEIYRLVRTYAAAQYGRTTYQEETSGGPRLLDSSSWFLSSSTGS